MRLLGSLQVPCNSYAHTVTDASNNPSPVVQYSKTCPECRQCGFVFCARTEWLCSLQSLPGTHTYPLATTRHAVLATASRCFFSLIGLLIQGPVSANIWFPEQVRNDGWEEVDRHREVLPCCWQCLSVFTYLTTNNNPSYRACHGNQMFSSSIL